MSSDISTVLGISLPAIIGGFGAFWTVHVYRKDDNLRKREIVFRLYDDFDQSEMMAYAKAILNYRVIEPERKWMKDVLAYKIVWREIQDDYKPLKDLLINEFGMRWVESLGFESSSEKNIVTIHNKLQYLSITVDEKAICCEPRRTFSGIRNAYHFCATTTSDGIVNKMWYFYHVSNLKNIMKILEEGPITDEGEHKIRNSFDALLDFFSRLVYLNKIRLIKKDELLYFSYFIDKIFDKENSALMEYAVKYGYKLRGTILETISRETKKENSRKRYRVAIKWILKHKYFIH